MRAGGPRVLNIVSEDASCVVAGVDRAAAIARTGAEELTYTRHADERVAGMCQMNGGRGSA